MMVHINSLLNVCNSFHSMKATTKIEQKKVKSNSKTHPNQCPDQGFTELYFMTFLVENSQVESKNGCYKN